MSDTAMIFHCAKPLIDENGNLLRGSSGKVMKSAPTHTLAFDKYDNKTIIVGWSKAHTNDTYNRKVGRELALIRIEQTRNRLDNYPDRVVKELDDVTDQHLPESIMTMDFDNCFNQAVTKLLDIDELNDVRVVFRTTRELNTVCSYNIDIDDIIISIQEIYSLRSSHEKLVAENPESKYIFCTYHDDEDNLMIAVQSREHFYATGLDPKVDDDMVEALDPIMSSGDGFGVLKEDGIVLTNDTMSEIQVIRYLAAAGMSYDMNLESEFGFF